MTAAELARMAALEAEVGRLRALEADRERGADLDRRRAAREEHARWRQAYYGERAVPVLASAADYAAIDRAVRRFHSPRESTPFVMPKAVLDVAA